MRTIRRHVYVFALAIAASVGCASAPKPSAASPAPAAEAPRPTPPSPTPAPARPRPAEPPRPSAVVEGGLVFAVEPAEARISVDGTDYGAVSDLSGSAGLLRLAPGIYQVSLRAPGHVTWRAEVALHQGTETIRVKLAKKP